MAVKPLALSFKDTAEDMELYIWIKGHSNISGFIKDTLRAAKENQTQKGNKKSDNNYENNNEVKKTELIDLEF